MEWVCEGVGVWIREDECDFVMMHEPSHIIIVHYSRYIQESKSDRRSLNGLEKYTFKY